MLVLSTQGLLEATSRELFVLSTQGLLEATSRGDVCPVYSGSSGGHLQGGDVCPVYSGSSGSHLQGGDVCPVYSGSSGSHLQGGDVSPVYSGSSGSHLQGVVFVLSTQGLLEATSRGWCLSCLLRVFWKPPPGG